MQPGEELPVGRDRYREYDRIYSAKYRAARENDSDYQAKISAYMAAWRKKNRNKRLAYGAARRAKQRGEA